MSRYLFFSFFFSLSYIVILTETFKLPLVTIGLHLKLVVWLLLLIYLLTHLIKKYSPNSKVAKVILALILTFQAMWTLIIYLLHWIGNSNWGSNVNLEFILNLPQQIHSLISNTANWPYAISIMIVISFFGLFYWLVSNFISQKKTHVFFKGNTRYFSYSLIYLVYIPLFVSLNFSNKDVVLQQYWANEPYLSALSNENIQYNNTNVLKNAILDNQVRELTLAKINTETDTKNVIIIIADALRADQMNAYGYQRNTTPFISEKMKEPGSQLVRNFTSTCSESACGIYSTLSSRRFKNITYGLYDLPDLLSDAGFSKNFILSSDHTHWYGLKRLYGNDFNVYIDGNDFIPEITLHDDDGVIHHLKNFPINNKEDKNFFYIHLMSSHRLGQNKDEFNLFQPAIENIPAYSGEKITNNLENLSRKVINGYDNGVLQLDDYIAKIHHLLKEKGYLKDSIFIITGDHGDSLGEQGYFYHTYNVNKEDIDIPFIIMTDQCTLQNTEIGTQIDIAPTVADCMNLPIPTSWQGISLLNKKPKERFTFHQTIRVNKEVLVIWHKAEQSFKMYASIERKKLKRFRLYEIHSDPDESTNIIKEKPIITKKLKQMIKEHWHLEIN